MTDTNEQLITYLGNKRKLVHYIEEEIQKIGLVLNKQSMDILEPFCGSTCVSRMLKKYSGHLVVNDLEGFCATIAKCYLANPSKDTIEKIERTIRLINKHKFSKVAAEFIRKHYAPKNDSDIKEGERVYYTQKNAHIIDTFCHHIFNHMPEEDRAFYMAPLLVEASIHTNTSGTFNSYHKKDGIGHFGGKGENALKRIVGEIEVPVPFFTVNDSKVDVYNMDANLLVKELNKKGERFDVAYLDPPYNKHPYGTNFFMLDIINKWNPEMDIPDNHRGQPDDWKRSKYNSFSEASRVFEELIKEIPAKFVILSYNNEGIIDEFQLRATMEKYGKVTKKEIVYPTYKGCKNLASRNKDVLEYLWILQKDTK
jgi:adenine-specific DNA-methyltransferase